VSGKLAVATLKPTSLADTRGWFGLKMADVTVSGGLDRRSASGFRLHHGSDAGLQQRFQQRQPGVVVKRLDWAKAFDLDGDGAFDDALNPGRICRWRRT